MPAPEICPNCGALVPRNARACPECGSDDETGWNDDAVPQRLGIPDDSFDYEEFTRQEFGDQRSRVRPRGVSWFWWVVAIALLILILWRFLA